MTISNLNATLVILLCGTAAWAGTIRPDRTQPNYDSILPNMAHSLPADTFAPSTLLPAGQTWQPPVAGTLVHGSTPLHYGVTKEEFARAGRELTSPLDPADPAVLARGQWVFENFCVACHGGLGAGDGTIVQRGYPAPKSLITGELVARADGQMFHALTYGTANMPSYAFQVTVEDRWNVIAYVRSLQAEAQAAAGPAPPHRPLVLLPEPWRPLVLLPEASTAPISEGGAP